VYQVPTNKVGRKDCELKFEKLLSKRSESRNDLSTLSLVEMFGILHVALSQIFDST